MALLQQWRDMAYDQQADKANAAAVLGNLFYKRKGYLRRTVKEPGRAGKRHG